MHDSLIYREQGKCKFCQISSSSVFYPLYKKITLVYFEQVKKKLEMLMLKVLTVFVVDVFPPVFLLRLAQNTELE